MQPLIGLDPLALGLATLVPGFRLGSTGAFDDPIQGTKMFVYGQAAGAQTIGQVCVEGAAGVWSPVTTTNSAPGQVGGFGTRVGVAQTNAVINQFGWYQVYGTCSALTAAAVAIGTRVNSTATPGAVDATGTVGARPINGMVWKTAVAGAQVGADCRLGHATVGLTL